MNGAPGEVLGLASTASGPAERLAEAAYGATDVRWEVDWATGSMVDHRFRYRQTGHTGTAQAVATAAGQPLGEPRTGHTERACAVATAVVDGRPVAITGSYDKTTRIWDLATGQPVGEPHTGHLTTAIAMTALDGRPVAVTGGAAARVWDPANGEQAGEPPTGHAGGGCARWRRRWSTGVRSRSPAAGTWRCGYGIWRPASRSVSP
ncbi:hypothetical protein GXW82_21885 [Streptacidiphilus sp. 4-A2]|nr:hypothetical protein [Streptacidiphilus sp. 4-A2]